MYSTQPNSQNVTSRAWCFQFSSIIPVLFSEGDTKKGNACVAENYADEVCLGNFQPTEIFSTNRLLAKAANTLHIFSFFVWLQPKKKPESVASMKVTTFVLSS